MLLGILIHEGIITEKRGVFIYSKLKDKFPPQTLEAVLKQLNETLDKN